MFAQVLALKSDAEAEYISIQPNTTLTRSAAAGFDGVRIDIVYAALPLLDASPVCHVSCDSTSTLTDVVDILSLLVIFFNTYARDC